MINNITKWLYNQLENDEVSLLYNGCFCDDIVANFIEFSELNINSTDELPKIRKRYSYLLADCFKSITSDLLPPVKKNKNTPEPGHFASRMIKNHHVIAYSHLIDTVNINKLKEKINQLNSRKQENIKELFTDIINSKELNEKSRIHSELIEMARRFNYPIEFSFMDFNDKSSLFFNQMIMTTEKDFEKNKVYAVNNLDELISIYRKMSDNSIFLAFKDSFQEDSLLMMFSNLEQNLQRLNVKITNHPFYTVLTELLKNIGKHSLKLGGKNEGILFICKAENKYMLTTGNYFEKAKAEELETKLKKIQSMTKGEIEGQYYNNLHAQKDKKRVETGLIKIAKVASKPIDFHIDNSDSYRAFITLQATIRSRFNS